MNRRHLRCPSTLSSLVLALATVTGCGPTSPPGSDEDAGEVPSQDAGSADAGVQDAGQQDAGQQDAGPPDAGQQDAGPGPSEREEEEPYVAPEPPPTTVTLSGTVKERQFSNPSPAQDVKVVLYNTDCDGDNDVDAEDRTACTATSSQQGAYSISNLPPASVLAIALDRTGETCTFENGNNATCSAAHFSTITGAKTGTNTAAAQDLYSVRYQWLLEQAVRCGVAAKESEAQPKLIQYSAILGSLQDASGTPISGLSATDLVTTADIGVSVDGYSNANDQKVCFLEADQGSYRVKLNGTVPATQATDTGLFLVFNLRNAVNQTGKGTVDVSVADLGSAQITLNAGKIGLLTFQAGVEVEPVERIVDFTDDIMPIFSRQGCVVCHKPDGPGANPPGGLLDFTAAPSAVHGYILGQSPGYPKVDLNTPTASLLLTMPLLEEPPNHPNASFESLQNPDAALILQWIEQGAPRYSTALPPEETNEPYTLTELMQAAYDIGCTNCHSAARNANYTTGTPGAPYGALPFDGCIPFYDYPSAYAPTDKTKAPADQPAGENQRCVYYHLAKQEVNDDVHYATQADNNGNGVAGEISDGRRVNPSAPEKSMLIRNPYCGPDDNNDNIGDGCAVDGLEGEKHPYRIFYDPQDSAYVSFRSWIEAGAKNDGTNAIENTVSAKATISPTTLDPTNPEPNTAGTAVFTKEADGKVKAVITLTGCVEGEHGFHIHDGTSCGPDGQEAGPHWDPRNAGVHGQINSGDLTDHHAGDVGTVTCDAQGNGTLTVTTDEWSLGDTTQSQYDPTGHAVIVHGKYDANDPDSGARRVACGVIQAN
ncbi:MAG: superoxide dismutase family protein [Myxococcota bacterium]